MKRLSIRRQLLTLFVPFLFSLWIASAVVSFWLVSTFSGESFDRDLINSADSVVARLRVKDGQVAVDLPPAALAILRQNESDRLYYRVIDSSGKDICGDKNMPNPSADLRPDTPKLVSAKVNGKSVRLAESKVTLDDGQNVIVQVAETTNVRRLFQQKMLLSIAVPQLFIIAVGLLAVWYGIAKILTPLRLLQEQVVNRSLSDLSSLSDADTPEEVFPLVKALNLLLQRLKEELAVHQRFIANAAHQLRTPLAGLKTYSSVGCEMSEVGELQHIVRELDRGIDRATRMVCQLLALARADGSESEGSQTKNQVDLNGIVSDLMPDLINQAKRKHIDLTYESVDHAAFLQGDGTGLSQLLTNLVENAISYSPNGSKVIVNIQDKEELTLTVTDSGPGIPSDEREKVFERFYRISGTTGNGSGLGLAIVREVANAHNAAVDIINGTDGTGTAVRVTFPRHRI